MANERTHTRSMRTMLPLTSEAQETLLEDLFAVDIPHYGQLFLPDDTFYSNQTGVAQANHMLKTLCGWLDIKPGYIGINFTADADTHPDGRKYTFGLKPEILQDEFLLGASIAYGLACYQVEHLNRVTLIPDQSNLIARASIMLGLGLVIANGLTPKYGWVSYIKRPNICVLHTFPESHYTYLLRSYIKKHRIQLVTFMPFTAPWVAKKLGVTNQRHVSSATLSAHHTIRLSNLKIIAMMWLFIMVCGLGGFVISNRIRPVSTTTLQAQEQLMSLQSLSQQCETTLAYNRQYADLADIQTVRKLNADQLTCQSLKNQHTAAELNYQNIHNHAR